MKIHGYFLDERLTYNDGPIFHFCYNGKLFNYFLICSYHYFWFC